MILWIIKTLCADFCQQRFVCACVVVYVFTCFDECGGSGGLCCQGNRACEGFTGRVCKDGSCTGDFACKDAYIPEVINSCKPLGSEVAGESHSCFEAAMQRPFKMIDSCRGFSACSNMGSRFLDEGVGSLTNSCHNVGVGGGSAGNGNGVCSDLGRRGSVGDVTSSCYGGRTCSGLGYGGTVGPITNSCGSQVNGKSVDLIDENSHSVMGFQNCLSVGTAYSQSISEITNCCVDEPEQCAGATSDEELIYKDITCGPTMVSC